MKKRYEVTCFVETSLIFTAFDTGLVLDPTNKVLIEGRGIANYEQQKINRHEHMNPAYHSSFDHMIETVFQCYYCS